MSLEKFSFSQKPCVIQSGNSAKFPSLLENQKLAYLFGTDEEPFIIIINLETGDIQNRPVPLQLKTYKYSSGALVSSNRLYLFGGVTDSMDKISKSAFLYNPISNNVEKLQNMIFPAYAFPTILINQYLYLIGGRKEGFDVEAIYNRC